MDATELLKQDHDTVRQMFVEFRSAKEGGDEQEMRNLQKRIFEELETHTRIEEDIFYPYVRNLGDEDLTDTVAEGIQEHHVVKTLMTEVSKVSTQETFEAKMTVLMENVEHHADEEESELFPELRERLTDDQLDELGERLEAAK